MAFDLVMIIRLMHAARWWTRSTAISNQRAWRPVNENGNVSEHLLEWSYALAFDLVNWL